MSLTVLSVAYSLAAVSSDSTGGAEQILAALDRGLVEAGHRSVVVAQAASRVMGTLCPIRPEPGPLDEAARARATAATRRAIADALRRWPIGLVHLHGIDCADTMPPPGVPVLTTLHLPADWYPVQALRPARPDTWFNCVSATQHAACPAGVRLVGPVANGVPLDALAARHAKRRYALFLGRICPEKGVHLAIEAAAAAGIQLLIAGELYAYAAHRRYFDQAVRPKLGPGCRFIGPAGFARKRRLLTAAHCVLVPSLAAETSSLVAREAAACGTSVIAFPNGALRDTVEDGRTGFLVDTVADMAVAIGRVETIEPATCRRAARDRFSERRMIDDYLALYARLARPAT